MIQIPESRTQCHEVVCRCAGCLYDNPGNLTAGQLAEVQKEVTDLLASSCLFRAAMHEPTTGQLTTCKDMKWQFTASGDRSGGYNASAGEITLGHVRAAPHELLHRLQDSYYGGTVMQDMQRTGYGESNIEFEVALFMDITGQWAISALKNFENGPKESINEDYKQFVRSIRSGGLPSDFDDCYFYFLEYFKEANPKYDMPIDPDMLPTFIKSLKNDIKDCNP